MAKGWPLLIIPLGAIGFTLYRQSIGLPSINDIYAQSSYVFFVNPLEGLWLNLRFILDDPTRFIRTPDLVALLLTLVLTLVMLKCPKHRRPALLAYTAGSILIFVTKINWAWGTDEVMYTQSFARYTVVLFPFAVLVADGLRHGRPWVRLIGVGVLMLSALTFAALNVLALSGP